jgi:hypothetical protein
LTERWRLSVCAAIQVAFGAILSTGSWPPEHAVLSQAEPIFSLR